MKKLFRRILLNDDWKPEDEIFEDYGQIDIDELKKMADERFDNLNLQGRFFYKYNNVLNKIEILRKFKIESKKT